MFPGGQFAQLLLAGESCTHTLTSCSSYGLPTPGPVTLASFFPLLSLRASSYRLSTRPLSRRYPTPFFMASLLCCGPKLAACGIVLSAWGVIMLVRVLTGENRRGPDGPRCWRAGRLGDPRP